MALGSMSDIAAMTRQKRSERTARKEASRNRLFGTIGAAAGEFMRMGEDRRNRERQLEDRRSLWEREDVKEREGRRREDEKEREARERRLTEETERIARDLAKQSQDREDRFMGNSVHLSLIEFGYENGLMEEDRSRLQEGLAALRERDIATQAATDEAERLAEEAQEAEESSQHVATAVLKVFKHVNETQFLQEDYKIDMDQLAIMAGTAFMQAAEREATAEELSFMTQEIERFFGLQSTDTDTDDDTDDTDTTIPRIDAFNGVAESAAAAAGAGEGRFPMFVKQPDGTVVEINVTVNELADAIAEAGGDRAWGERQARLQGQLEENKREWQDFRLGLTTDTPTHDETGRAPIDWGNISATTTALSPGGSTEWPVADDGLTDAEITEFNLIANPPDAGNWGVVSEILEELREDHGVSREAFRALAKQVSDGTADPAEVRRILDLVSRIANKQNQRAIGLSATGRETSAGGGPKGTPSGKRKALTGADRFEFLPSPSTER